MFKLIVSVLTLVTVIQAKPNHPKIIGGSSAAQGQFPYLASLRRVNTGEKYHFCGAGIISDLYLISAGHCVKDENPSEIAAYVGSVYLDEGGVYYEIEKWAVYPGFEPVKPAYDDVSVIKLVNPIKFNENVKPINLPVDVVVNPGDDATATGWGTFKWPIEEIPNQLQYLTQKIVDTEECSAALDSDIRSGQICLAGEVGHGLCFGDSGSPLIYTADDKNYVIGVVSWGNPCALGDPDVYTRISYYIPWIQEQLTVL